MKNIILKIMISVGLLALSCAVATAQDTAGTGQNTTEEKTSDSSSSGIVTVSLIDQINAENQKVIKQKVAASLNDVVKIGDTNKRIVEFDRLRLEGVLDAKQAMDTHVGKAQWKSLALDIEDGSVKRKFLSSPLESEVKFKGTLEPGHNYSATGNITSLIADAKELLGEEVEKVAEEVEEALEGSGDGQTLGASGSSGQNDGYDPGGLSIYEPDKTPEITPDTVYGTTTDGCEVRLSDDLTTVYEQSKTTEDGTPVGNCADSGRSFTVNFSEDSCPLEYEAGAEFANILFKAFYIKDAETRYLQKDGKDCFRHLDKKYAVSYNETACPDNPAVSPDSDTGQVMVRGEPFATRTSGEYVRLAQCADVEEVDITWITDDCGISDDWTTEKSYQKQKAVYTYKDRQYPALGCVTRNSVSYDMEKVDANCPVTKVGSGADAAIIKAYDYVIYVDGEQKLRQSCRADTTSVPVIYNKAACIGTFIHDEDLSYGTVKLQFEDPDTEQLRDLGQCERNLDEKYEHKIQTIDWRPVDDELIAYPMRETYIDTNVGHRTVKTEESDVPDPYVFVKTGSELSGTIFYEGCRRYQDSGIWDTYSRPNNSTYKRLVEAGAPLDEGDRCQPIVTWDEENPSLSRGAVIVGKNGTDWTFSCRVYRSEVATRDTVREDGVIMSSESQTGQIYQHSHTAYNSNTGQGVTACGWQGTWAAYPSEITNSQKASLEAGWGW
ncbi:hypothetical protein ACTU44_21880 (plasmid) [Thalassospira sp. SM2505]